MKRHEMKRHETAQRLFNFSTTKEIADEEARDSAKCGEQSTCVLVRVREGGREGGRETDSRSILTLW